MQLVARYEAALRLAARPLLVRNVMRAGQQRPVPLETWKVARLATRFHRSIRHVETASTVEEHLLMAAAIIGFDPGQDGSVVECGCYKGGSTVNLSLVCALAGRSLEVYDSFSGLPHPTETSANYLPADALVHEYEAGMYAGSLEEVEGNVRRHGRLEVCSFHPGWFQDTLTDFSQPCVVAFLDVDLLESLQTCEGAVAASGRGWHSFLGYARKSDSAQARRVLG